MKSLLKKTAVLLIIAITSINLNATNCKENTNVDMLFYVYSQLQGRDYVLSVSADGNKLEMQKKQAGNMKQLWYTEYDGNMYTTIMSASDEGQCFDVVNGGNDRNGYDAKIAKCAGLTGQSWQIKDLGNGWSKLSTKFKGEDLLLTCDKSGKGRYIRLYGDKNVPGQLWRIEDINNPYDDSQITSNEMTSGDWRNLRYINFQMELGEEMKDKYKMVSSMNMKYLLYLNKDNVPELGEVINNKRQEEDELVQTKAIYTFPTAKASWLNATETRFYLQERDGNLQYENPNKQYWGMTDGRDANKSVLGNVYQLKVTDDGRIILVDEGDNELWSHR